MKINISHRTNAIIELLGFCLSILFLVAMPLDTHFNHRVQIVVVMTGLFLFACYQIFVKVIPAPAQQRLADLIDGFNKNMTAALDDTIAEERDRVMVGRDDFAKLLHMANIRKLPETI